MTKTNYFDYYIFVDYSESLVGYNIIEKNKIPEIIKLIHKFRHYKDERHKKTYLFKIKKEIEKSNLLSLILKQKIIKIKDNLILFTEIIDFVKNHNGCLIFMSVDNNQFIAFTKLIELVSVHNIKIIKESDLKKDSIEHKLSLIIDTMLNLERMSK